MARELEYKDFNGVARQGDVLIFRLPKSITVSEVNEMSPTNGRLIVLEGEMTGHHHAIDVMDRPTHIPMKPSKTVEDIFFKAQNVTGAVVKMYNDRGVVDQLVAQKILNRSDLFIGVLSIKNGGDVGCLLKHDEHDAIRLTEGCYYVGRQIESAGAEERVVRD